MMGKKIVIAFKVPAIENKLRLDRGALLRFEQ
jgi:hypothetical protein